VFATTLALTIETMPLSALSSWNAFESLAVQMAKDLARQALAGVSQLVGRCRLDRKYRCRSAACWTA
jgi:hypothetical protein